MQEIMVIIMTLNVHKKTFKKLQKEIGKFGISVDEGVLTLLFEVHKSQHAQKEKQIQKILLQDLEEDDFIIQSD